MRLTYLAPIVAAITVAISDCITIALGNEVGSSKPRLSGNANNFGILKEELDESAADNEERKGRRGRKMGGNGFVGPGTGFWYPNYDKDKDQKRFFKYKYANYLKIINERQDEILEASKKRQKIA
ncbi:RxLR-like protein [Plasmopara halstedii]|uniref:RxLR-like protein n=1 Tax=Plasmopara halstedii TaxID=4781 RepID=A0A0P1ABC6_PLAHL|nr:RxLR-like protein [Plasmopara halstedii]CEG38137.1 RxLR-like protein [Plasmopara halstedii]|eukprot:XP_024574506.1 RxLR-like protein [Plasmopara halstedii]